MKSRPKNLWIFENVQSPRAILVFLLNLDYVKIKQLPYMIISVKKPSKNQFNVCKQHTEVLKLSGQKGDGMTPMKRHNIFKMSRLSYGWGIKIGVECCLCIENNWKHWLKLCHFHDGKSQISITSYWEDIGSTITKKDLSILYNFLIWYPSYQIIVKYKIHNYSTILYVSDILYEKGNNS